MTTRVALFNARDYDSSYGTRYSTNPELVAAWINSPEPEPSEELVQHVIFLWAGEQDEASVRDVFADAVEYINGTPWDFQNGKITHLALMLPPAGPELYAAGFDLVAEYEGQMY